MEMPRYSGLVRLVAQIGAVIGCILGSITVLGGFASFRMGFLFGLTTISGGVYLILGSLAGLGLAYCLLALVQAQIDTRNAVIEYIDSVRARR